MKNIFFALFAIGFLFSCSDDDGDCNVNVVPINLTSRVVIAERAPQQDIQIAAGQQISFFVTRTGSITPTDIIYNNVTLTADGDGFFTYGTNMFYPVENINVDFYGVHPYVATTDLNSQLSFAVNSNQSILANYYNSDLLYARVPNVARTQNAVPLVFDHKLTKLTFVVKQGTAIDLGGFTGMSVLNVNSQVAMNVSDGTLVPVAGNNGEISVYGVRATTESETEVDGMTAIIVPQTFTGATPLFRLTINGAEYFYSPPSNIVFEAGKVYNYTLTVNNTGILVTSSINNWLPGGNTEGEVS